LWLSKSNHKYDAADFRKIDPHFGTDTEFRDFVSEAHCLGMRIILDIALNHTGETFWAFQDCRIKGAASPYWNWYDWHKWPLPDPLPEDFQPKEYYQCWWGIKDMPDLNYDLLRQHPEENEITDISQAQPNWAMINHILDAMQSWLTEMDIDGFRLDVPNEVPFWFWQLFRQRIKALKPDAWLVGELWANPLQWVSDKYFDSVMNYAHFKDPVIDYFIKGSLDTGSFIQKLYYGLTNSPASSCYAMMNLLSSHDTWRIREIALNSLSIHDGMPNSDLALGKSEFANPLISGSDASLSLVDRVQRDIALNKQKLAILFQMTYPGAPHIYYGDEIGMRGAADPDNRRPMNWNWQTDAESREIHAYYQRLIRLRKKHPILQTGLIKFIYHPELLIFHRYDVCECIVVLINNTDSAVSYHCPETPVESYHPEAACLSPDIMLQPYSALIYKYIL
jgi:glycosidase